jgi:hypothetical protein
LNQLLAPGEDAGNDEPILDALDPEIGEITPMKSEEYEATMKEYDDELTEVDNHPPPNRSSRPLRSWPEMTPPIRETPKRNQNQLRKVQIWLMMAGAIFYCHQTRSHHSRTFRLELQEAHKDSETTLIGMESCWSHPSR